MKKLVLALSTGILAATLCSTSALAGSYSKFTFGVGSGPHYSVDYSRHHQRYQHHDQHRGYYRDSGNRSYYNRHGHRHERHHYNRHSQWHGDRGHRESGHYSRFNNHRSHASAVIQYRYYN